MARAIKLSFYVVSAALLLLTAVLLAFSSELPMGWFPFSFAALLKTVGVVCGLAALAEIFREKMWGKWTFAFFFALIAYRMLTANHLPLEYPQDPERQFGLAVIPVVLSFGAMHLTHNPKKE